MRPKLLLFRALFIAGIALIVTQTLSAQLKVLADGSVEMNQTQIFARSTDALPSLTLSHKAPAGLSTGSDIYTSIAFGSYISGGMTPPHGTLFFNQTQEGKSRSVAATQVSKATGANKATTRDEFPQNFISLSEGKQWSVYYSYEGADSSKREYTIIYEREADPVWIAGLYCTKLLVRTTHSSTKESQPFGYLYSDQENKRELFIGTDGIR